MSIKLIVTDIDGTLVDVRGRMHRRTAAALREAASRGVIVAIASGRSYCSADAVPRSIGLTDCPVISCNGAVVQSGGCELSRTPMTPESIMPSIMLSRKLCVSHFMQSRDLIYMYSTGSPELDKRIIEESPVCKRPEEAGMLRLVFDEMDLATVINTGVDKQFIYIAEARRLAEARLAFEKAAYYGELPECYITSSGPENFELMRSGVNKGVGLQTLASAMDIRRDEILAIGDNENDVEMLRFAGTAVAMGNASPGAIAASTFVTLPVTEGGAGEAIRRFVL